MKFYKKFFVHLLEQISKKKFNTFFKLFISSYITPKNAEGFAPHWDDVDAFLLQLEGRKHWVVCAPPNEFEALPIKSSENFTDDILKEWPVVFDDWLEEGDTLYIPRGFIHKVIF